MVAVTYSQAEETSVSNARRQALRLELEDARRTFHTLLDRYPPARWDSKSPATDWTIKEVFDHLTWALEQLPAEIESARRGRGMFNYPKWLAEPGSYWITRWTARAATPASLARRYDAAIDAALRLLDQVQDDDWSKGADFYGHGFHSVEDLFHAPAHHLSEHTAGLSTQ